MFRRIFRGGFAPLACAAVLLGAGSARAQGPYYTNYAPEPTTLVHSMVTGAQYDIMNQEKARQRLPQIRERLARDEARGNTAAVGRDLRKIQALRYRIVVDEWLIRKNRGVEPGCYPYPLCWDGISYAAVSQYHIPPQAP